MTVRAVDPEIQRQRAGAMWDLHQAWTGRLIDAGLDGPVPPGRKDPSDYNQHFPDMEADGAAMDAFASIADVLMGVTAPRGMESDGNARDLHHYWTRGEGLAKWADSPQPWTSLYHHLVKFMDPEEAKRTAANWFHDVFHFWPGSDVNRVTHGKPPRGKKIGPG